MKKMILTALITLSSLTSHALLGDQDEIQRLTDEQIAAEEIAMDNASFRTATLSLILAEDSLIKAGVPASIVNGSTIETHCTAAIKQCVYSIVQPSGHAYNAVVNFNADVTQIISVNLHPASE